MAEETLPPESPPPPKKFNPRTVAWWHEALADWLIQNPDKHAKDAAVVFDTSPSYIYMLKNSDTFKAYFAGRRKQLSAGVEDKAASMFGTLSDKLAALAEASLDVLNARMEQVALAGSNSSMPNEQLLQTADMALKKLGYGLPVPGQSSAHMTQVNVNVSADLLAAAREKMAKLYRTQVAEPVLLEGEGKVL
ncbi:MAG: hypothetical protein IPK54_10015 [Dokdonella sp.]|uniref:hypothetical protein n=1 Tax=Dokdonella sp. TaxID=2291710 RepID=UPI0025C63A55|nr:hypothetical protein [Dokdonella sp.]MBK8123866.1 hypothetical protein [Dokdonella sp.]